MNDFCAGRAHDSFEIFFKNFVPAIVAKNKFKTRLFAPMRNDIHMCTVSDEACTLLLLENNYDRWIDVYKNKLAGTTTMDTGLTEGIRKRKRKWESDVTPKYTEGGIAYSTNRKMTHKGWKEEGILRYNALCFMVKSDRLANPTVLVEMVRTWKEEMHRTPTVESNDVITGTEVYHELWEEAPEHIVQI
jgi:hypothetical protein